MDFKSTDVKDFLRDINHFLANTLETESLSSNAQAEREELLRRLSCLPESAPPYIDMSCSTKSSRQSGEYVALETNEDRVDSKLYEEFPNQSHNLSLSQEENQQSVIIEHLMLPAPKLRSVSRKFGPLWRKEKFMGIFVERSIRCWGGLLGFVLYIYNTDKEAKPASYINVQGFEARPAVTSFPRDVKKRDCSFELVCPGKKSFQFSACTLKDMEEWINCINEASTQESHVNDVLPRKRQLPSLPNSLNGGEEYDDVHSRDSVAKSKNHENGDEIYHNIRDLTLVEESLAVSSVPPASETKIVPDNELIYDDIGAHNSGLYYNMTEQRTEGTIECSDSAKECDPFGYNDGEDIYDDIGIMSNTEVTAGRQNGNIDISNRHFCEKKNIVLRNVKRHVFNQLTSDVTDSVFDENVSCFDNLYEPVDNPRDESNK